MTISTTASRISYNGNGSTTAFSFPYRFLTNADLTVIKVAADGTETTLVLNTDYTVAGADQDAGGTVTIGTAPLSGQRLVIFREIGITQEVDYITGDAFPAETHERALDRLTMIAQQHQDAIDRSAKLSETSTADADTLIANINALAAIEDDVSAVAGIDTDVSVVATIDTNVTTVAGIAANVTTVAGIATNVTAVAGNATNINTVAGIAANVTTVAGISADVTAVAADAADIGTVAADIADINTCADNMAAILDAPAQASAAAASAAAAAASLDNFDDRYLGAKNSAPSVDNDGNALVAGALYFNTGVSVADDKGMWIYDGGTWIQASAASQAILVRYKYVATAAQTTFTGADANGLTLSYTAGSIIVTLNGVVMDAADYTATSGNSVVLASGAAASNEVCVFAFSTFDIANTYTQAQVDAFAVKLTGDQTVAGVKTFSGATTVMNGNVGIGTSSPSAQLHVKNAGGNSISILGQYGSGTIAQIGAYSNQVDIKAYNGTNDVMTFTTGASERMRIDSSGNVGVGTSTPDVIRLRSRGQNTSSSNYALWAENSNPTTLFSVRNDGYISTGLAATSPYNATIGLAANLHVYSADGGLYRATSSIKYKRDVVDYTGGLDAVSTLRPVFYKGVNPIEGETVYAGFIAEEVHEAGLTEFVQYADDGTPDALSYGNMVSLCVKAIQELKAELDAAKADIATLKGAA